MDLTYVDAQNLKSLEHYAVALVMGILSLKTLETYHIKAEDLGILKDDMSCRANTIVWDLRRDIKLYYDQLQSILELLPDDFNPDSIVESLKIQELTKARQMTRKKKINKCNTNEERK
mgnify:CR=1 FL=1